MVRSKTQVSQLEKQLQTKTDQLSELETKLGQKDTEIADLKTQISTLKGQVTSLHAEMKELQSLIPPYQRGSWNLIQTFKGSSYLVNTDYFHVAGTRLRINWTWVRPNPEYGSFSIYLYKEAESGYTEAFWNLEESGTTFAYNIIPSYYYLKILGANLDYWVITVEVWIPE